VLILWTASKKSLISQPSLFLFTLYHRLSPLAVMCTRLALLQPKPYPLARVCSRSATKGILIALVDSRSTKEKWWFASFKFPEESYLVFGNWWLCSVERIRCILLGAWNLDGRQTHRFLDDSLARAHSVRPTVLQTTHYTTVTVQIAHRSAR
jgi:hypothetical protein